IQLTDPRTATGTDTLVAHVARVAFLGDRTEYTVELEDRTQWRLRLEHDQRLSMREAVGLRVSPGMARAFARDAAVAQVAAAIDPDAASPEPAQA
ncbi:MAG: TOBE domain-containing protein, partial [Candidatus Limnocylindria bacterium]